MIVNPVIFYLAEMSGTVAILFITVGIVLLIAGVCYALWLAEEVNDDIFTLFRRRYIYYKDDEIKRVRKEEVERANKTVNRFLNVYRRMMIIGAVLVLISCLLPSKQTIYKMLIAKTVTVENIEDATDKTLDFVDELIERYNTVTEK